MLRLYGRRSRLARGLPSNSEGACARSMGRIAKCAVITEGWKQVLFSIIKNGTLTMEVDGYIALS